MRFFSIAYFFVFSLVCIQCIQAPRIQNESPQGIELFNLKELEQSIHQLVNKERSKRRLDPLRWNHPLYQIARNHSEDMLVNNFFSHNSVDGKTPVDRADVAGFECTIITEGTQRIGIGENLLTTFSYHSYEVFENEGEEAIRYNWKTVEELAQETVTTWMNSPPHRRNLLRPDYIQQGIGAVVGQEQKIFITQNFC